MTWDVEYTDEFGLWWADLDEDRQDRIAATVSLLATHGPALAFPHSSGINGSRHAHMRELRVRIFYAFDPRRTAILLIGGDKTGKDRFYIEHLMQADDLYDAHIAELKAEGLI